MSARSTRYSYCVGILTLGVIGDILEIFPASPCVANLGNPCGGYVTVKYW